MRNLSFLQKGGLLRSTYVGIFTMKLLKYAHERSPDQGLRMGSEMKKKKQNHNTKPNQTKPPSEHKYL